MKQTIKGLSILGILVFLAGCAGQPTVTQTKFEIPEISNPEPPPQLQLRDVEFQVYNKEELKKLIEEANKRGQDVALFALTAEEYEDLSTNMQDIKGYISKQKEIIIYYRRTWKEIKALADKQNNNGDDDEVIVNQPSAGSADNADEEDSGGGFFSNLLPF